MTYVKRRKGWRMSCNIGKATEALHILQAFRHFTYVTADSLTLQSLYQHHSSFSNPSVALPTSQPVLQPFRCFAYGTAHPPTILSILLRDRLFTYVTWRAAHVLNICFLKSCLEPTFTTTFWHVIIIFFVFKFKTKHAALLAAHQSNICHEASSTNV